MVDLLVKLFVKNYENVEDVKVRESYGMLSSIVGIVNNIVLFVAKYIMGTMANSISIVSDGFNNLSDCGSCIVTMLGYKMAAKPADRDHPFGHGRMEYLSALVMAGFIMLMGIELFRNSLAKVIHPEKVEFSVVVLVVLVISIGVKLWMAIFNRILGKKINSGVMEATSKDSRNDAIATAGTAIALCLSLLTDLPVDGIMGIIVSAIILWAGFGIVKDTVDELLGKPADKELVDKLCEITNKDSRIIGMHDLILHNYGPGNTIGSCHLEVRSDENILEIHDLIDRIEREVYEKLNIVITIHMDPVEVDNELVNDLREKVRAVVKGIDNRMHIHDFRVVTGNTHTNLIFDIVVPFDVKETNEEIKEKIDEYMGNESATYYTVITFDKEF